MLRIAFILHDAFLNIHLNLIFRIEFDANEDIIFMRMHTSPLMRFNSYGDNIVYQIKMILYFEYARN